MACVVPLDEPMTRSADLVRLAEQTPGALLRGAGAGVAATVAMSGLMLVAQRAGLLGRSPPRHIVEHGLARLHLRRKVPRTERQLLAALAHLGFGASQGALYAALHTWFGPRLPRSRSQRGGASRPPTAATGVPFALLVWATSYAGWIPALGILPSPSRDRPGRPLSMVLAHVVYGAVLASTLRKMPGTPRRDEPPANPPR